MIQNKSYDISHKISFRDGSDLRSSDSCKISGVYMVDSGGEEKEREEKKKEGRRRKRKEGRGKERRRRRERRRRGKDQRRRREKEEGVRMVRSFSATSCDSTI